MVGESCIVCPDLRWLISGAEYRLTTQCCCQDLKLVRLETVLAAIDI